MTIPTIDGLRPSRQRLNRLNREVEKVRAVMRNGAVLHRSHERGRTIWWLSTGPFVPGDVATVVITRPHIVSVGDSLFADTPAQTWRYQPGGLAE